MPSLADKGNFPSTGFQYKSSYIFRLQLHISPRTSVPSTSLCQISARSFQTCPTQNHQSLGWITRPGNFATRV
jgi:hypothetical protein